MLDHIWITMQPVSGHRGSPLKKSVLKTVTKKQEIIARAKSQPVRKKAGIEPVLIAVSEAGDMDLLEEVHMPVPVVANQRVARRSASRGRSIAASPTTNGRELPKEVNDGS